MSQNRVFIVLLSFRKWSRLASTYRAKNASNHTPIDVHFLGHFSSLYNVWGFIHWQLCLGKCIFNTKKLGNYAVDLDFIGFVLKAFKALSKVSVKHLLAAVRVKRGQILPVKSLFLFFCRSEMYSYHRNNIATIWHMQEKKLTSILMQQFSL